MTVRLFVNEQPVVVEDDCDIRTAVSCFDKALGVALEDGRAFVTDGVGLELDLSQRVSAGSILRVVVSARRASSGESSE